MQTRIILRLNQVTDPFHTRISASKTTLKDWDQRTLYNSSIGKKKKRQTRCVTRGLASYITIAFLLLDRM